MNIVSLLGLVVQGEVLLLYEYAELGRLSNYLQTHREEWFLNQVDSTGRLLPLNEDVMERYRQAADRRHPPSDDSVDFDWQILSARTLIRFGHHVSRGVQYLHSCSIVHRDLWAANVLVFDGLVAKISEFGVAKQGAEYVGQDEQEKNFRFRWMAPESINDRRFSAASDIWSLGVVLWEIFSIGSLPYAIEHSVTCDAATLTASLKAGLRLQRSETCPSVAYSLIMDCWSWIPEERADAARLEQVLRWLNDNIREENYLPLDYWYALLDGSQADVPMDENDNISSP
ncbi:tyrosine-protein kinase receptor Tie-1-like [Paramacrobiotus metropolitanus]|uniref:tyrosine-protein kinase receptor Tie-1-like n=1 Tax=Paramacrobiotus metropolitanus TaxID=2943436 RepID=UPI00244608BD|nr:tyrosine-protein kinase receptor Tie-1-like [Paramacrobiotus metropolitanus]